MIHGQILHRSCTQGKGGFAGQRHSIHFRSVELLEFLHQFGVVNPHHKEGRELNPTLLDIDQEKSVEARMPRRRRSADNSRFRFRAYSFPAQRKFQHLFSLEDEVAKFLPFRTCEVLPQLYELLS